jgi:hypothetical protein
MPFLGIDARTQHRQVYSSSYDDFMNTWSLKTECYMLVKLLPYLEPQRPTALLLIAPACRDNAAVCGR